MTRLALGGPLLLIGLALAGCPGGGGRPDDHDGGQPPVCHQGRRACGESCVDLQSDPSNCGECGEVCGDSEPNCAAGRCVADCGPLARCDGACVSLASDPDHCGSCDRQCGEDAPSCSAGECVATCEEPCEGGACPNLQSDPSHCGACFFACDADERCEAGTCVSDAPCPDGQILCDALCVPEGACVCAEERTDCDPSPNATECRDLRVSDEACGSCDRACGEEQDCVAAQCVAECGEDQTRCDDGCFDLHRDPEHCGRCDRRCGEGQICAEEHCVDGQWVDCDSCPCDECPDRAEPPQRCCAHDGEVACVAGTECPED